MDSPRAGPWGVPPSAAGVPGATGTSTRNMRLPMKRRGSGRFSRGRHVDRVADAVALHASPERDARDAERRRGALAVPAVRLEHAQDARALVDDEPGLPPPEELGERRAARLRQYEQR